ncbi:MAG: winged helix-turn-helix transcriptional regulator [Thermoplasmatota archaeon]
MVATSLTPRRQARADLLAIVRTRGGAHKSALCATLGKGWGTVSHHLRVLEDRGVVVREVHGRRTWYFDARLPVEARTAVVAIHSEVARRILTLMQAKRTATIRSLGENLGASLKVVRVHVAHLVKANLLQKSQGKPIVFRKPRRRRAGELPVVSQSGQ